MGAIRNHHVEVYVSDTWERHMVIGNDHVHEVFVVQHVATALAMAEQDAANGAEVTALTAPNGAPIWAAWYRPSWMLPRGAWVITTTKRALRTFVEPTPATETLEVTE